MSSRVAGLTVQGCLPCPAGLQDSSCKGACLVQQGCTTHHAGALGQPCRGAGSTVRGRWVNRAGALGQPCGGAGSTVQGCWVNRAGVLGLSGRGAEDIQRGRGACGAGAQCLRCGGWKSRICRGLSLFDPGLFTRRAGRGNCSRDLISEGRVRRVPTPFDFWDSCNSSLRIRVLPELSFIRPRWGYCGAD